MRPPETRTATTAILAEGLDVSFYDSPEDIAAHVEAIDVRAGTFTAWLADGHVIALHAPEKWGRVTATVSGDDDPNGLRAKLLEVSAAIGVPPPDVEALSLEQLVDRVMAAQRAYQERRRGPVRKLLARLMPRLFGS
jgi:hypothetical protein